MVLGMAVAGVGLAFGLLMWLIKRQVVSPLSVAVGQIGRLDVRADAGRHEGDYRTIVDGINRTLEAVIDPLNVAAEYIDQISKGEIPPPITQQFKGDFNEIKRNLNACIAALNLMRKDVRTLAAAALSGQLQVRADVSPHQGAFRSIVGGFNETLNAVIGPLNVAAEYVDRISKGDIPPRITDQYQGDFNAIRNNLNTCIDAINALIADAAMLAGAAVEGRLTTRADSGRHQGDFKKIVQGVNDTLDAVIGPLTLAADYVRRIGNGDIPAKITASFQGDFDGLKRSLDACIDGLAGLQESNAVVQLLTVNDLTRRVEGHYQGVFAEVA
jgi:methyl-accepting chemotaxis protein